MTHINGTDYNITINTPRYALSPMRTDGDYEALLNLCSKLGFTYPYIHSHQKTQSAPLADRVRAYTKLGDTAANGEFGRTMIQSIRRHEDSELLGASILIAIEPDYPLFDGSDPTTEWEIGFFTDIDHWGKGIATEAIHATIEQALENKWGLTGLWASVEPSRPASIKLIQNLGLELVREIPAGSELVPYNDEQGRPAARQIYHTPENWKLPGLSFKG
jgi:GNAT superfamily N-acetyltransferase